MRPLLLCISLLALVAGAGCHCSPANPTPVTIKVNNRSNGPILVDDTAGKLGAGVERQVGGQWFGFRDTGDCACLACSAGCDPTCSCADGGTPFVRVMMPGEVDSRTWDGVVQVSATQTCNGESLGCLTPENAPGDETFNVHFCFQTQQMGIDLSDGGRVEAQLNTTGQTCVDQQFHPSDGVVEVGPVKGAACTTLADCRGTGELCLSGACTSGCPANGFPPLGASWALRIPSADDRGFFSLTTDAKGRMVQTGTGTITSVAYQGQTMVVNLTEGDGGTGNDGTLYVDFPPGYAAPLVQDTHVSVKLIDGSTTDNPENRAVIVTEPAGKLLLAADMAQQGALLDASDTAPFTVKWATEIVGCAITACGKELFVQADFQGPAMEVKLDPGATANQTTAQGLYQLLNVGSGTYPETTCGLTDLRPYALWYLHP